ncbi:phage tail protein [Sphingobacterium hungaricum]|uniref:Tail spike domain-containing protein n=1 Tax=Sphingobacterium hungaricum TaxID=2082723 RepID=A0A928YPI2_9SPHI|nr:phage tail protein [Sphingobacterium hungaricum]MBE8712527.1 hypothetical protein [Sphingobacterium hungaricum]
MNIQVYRGANPTITLPLQNGVFTRELMGVHELVFTFYSTYDLDLSIGDTLTYKGEVMTINATSPRNILDSHNEYTITFQGHRHDLERWIIKDEGALSFDYFGTIEEYLLMFLDSLNTDDSGWTMGEFEVVEPLPLSFDKVYYWNALNDIAQLFGCEWSVRGKVISVVKTAGIARDISLSIGKDNGLYSLSLQQLDNKKIVTRAYAFGGTQNLPQSYPYKNLTLEGYLDDAEAIALYGVREGVVSDETIFPQRTSTATAVGQINEENYTLSDSTIDFNLSDYFIDGGQPKIVFKSGDLNGQEFEITSYNDSNKTLRYKANKSEKGDLIPKENYSAEVGDSYTLVGIRMPESYKENALEEIADLRLQYLNDNKAPRVAYDLDIDILDLKRKAITPDEGDIIQVSHPQIGLYDNLRVTSVSYSALFPDILIPGMEFIAEVGNDVTYTFFQKIEKDIKENKKVITQTTKQSWERDRTRVQALKEFEQKVFDPDGNLETAMVRGIAGLFGNESMYFDLDGVEMDINVGGDPNTLTLTAGRLIHRKYEIDGIGSIWNLTAFSASGLDPLVTYYLSAKCSRTGLIGEWVLSENQISVDAEAGFWHFNLGILSSVIDGIREFTPTKLFTLISGGLIETDVITAYMINVQRLFAQLIEVGSEGFTNSGISGLSENGNQSIRFWAGQTGENRSTAPFRVLNDGSMSATKGKIGGFVIDATNLRSEVVDPGSGTTSPSSGIILSDLGVLSRNSGMSFLPGSSGLDFSASIVGETSEERPATRPILYPNVRAGIFGIRRQDLTSQVIAQLQRAWGQYGAMTSSLKNLGAVYNASRIHDANADTIMTANDYLLIKAGDNSNVNLPNVAVEIGREVIVKNATSGTITVYGNGSNIYTLGTNTSVSSTTLIVGLIRTYRYSGSEWIEG